MELRLKLVYKRYIDINKWILLNFYISKLFSFNPFNVTYCKGHFHNIQLERIFFFQDLQIFKRGRLLAFTRFLPPPLPFFYHTAGCSGVTDVYGSNGGQSHIIGL